MTRPEETTQRHIYSLNVERSNPFISEICVPRNLFVNGMRLSYIDEGVTSNNNSSRKILCLQIFLTVSAPSRSISNHAGISLSGLKQSACPFRHYFHPLLILQKTTQEGMVGCHSTQHGSWIGQWHRQRSCNSVQIKQPHNVLQNPHRSGQTSEQ